MSNFFLLLAANLIVQVWNQNVFPEKLSIPLMLPYDECKAMDIVDLYTLISCNNFLWLSDNFLW